VATHYLALDYVRWEKTIVTDPLASDVAAIRAKTDLLSFNLTDVISTLDGETPNVNNALGSVPNLDVAISTRSVAGDEMGLTPAAINAIEAIAFDVASLGGDVNALENLKSSALSIVVGNAVAGLLSNSQMSTDLTATASDHYKGRIIIWITGNLAKQATDITAYNGATKVLTFTTVTSAPSVGDRFVIL
jgi:hypothetical protein